MYFSISIIDWFQFINKIKTIILRCFWKNVNILLRKSKFINDDLEISSDDPDQENFDEKKLNIRNLQDLLKHQSFFKLEAPKFHFPKYKKVPCLFPGFLLFFKLRLKGAGFHFWKYKKSFLLRNYKEDYLLRKYRKRFSLRKCKNLFNIRARKFQYPEI